MSGETDTTVSDRDFLAEGSDDENLGETGAEPTEDIEVPEAEETEETDETETPEEPEETDESSVTASETAKEITAKYANVFKDFPQLRKALFEAEKFAEVFPTVEVAKAAAEKVSQFEELGGQLFEGNIGALLDSIHDVDQVGPKAIVNIVSNFLPQVFERSPDLWRHAVDPLYRGLVREMEQKAVREKDKGLYATAKNLSLFLYGDKDLPKDQPVNRDDPEKQELRQRLQGHEAQATNSFINSIREENNSILSKEINNKIDPKVSSGIREVIIDRTLDEIAKIMKLNKENVDLVNRLLVSAKRSGFTAENRKAIVSAYIRPAKALIGKVTAEVAGKIVGSKAPAKTGEKIGSSTGPTSEKIDAKKVDWSKTSTRDYLAGRVSFRK